MDPRLLRHYNQELQHLREMGAEFAVQFPKIAARLRLEGLEVADPYVERLLEGLAFLSARVQVKLDAEFPRFTHRLVEILYPGFLAPVPSMLVAQLHPEPGAQGLADGLTIARGSTLLGHAGKAGSTACRFRTAHDLTLWPLEIAAAEYFAHSAALPLAAAPEWKKFGGGVRITLRTTGGVDFSALALSDLRLYCAAADEIAYRLHELVCGCPVGIFVLAGTGNGARHELLGAESIEPVGFDEDQALLPRSLRGFDGYRLLQEYFAFPQRFLYFDLRGIGDALRRVGGQQVDLVILFARGDTVLQQSVDAASFALNSVPAVNLFEHRCDRVQITPAVSEHHVVADRTRPMDYEVHQVRAVTGYGVGQEGERRFHPLYAAFHSAEADREAYYTMRREPRLLSEVQRREGPRSSYIGSEVFLSIVDLEEAPYAANLQQLAVEALCSNRDLPLLMPTGGPAGDLQLEQTAPIALIRLLRGPSRPQPAQREASLAWRFIHQLTLNHLSLLDTDEEQGASALREMLRLHVHEGDAALQRQIDGVRSIRKRQVVRRLPMPGPIAFGRGVELEVEVDELAFQGGSAFLLGCVLERFFARHVSMNGFTQMRLRSQTRGELLRGRPRAGARPVL